MHQYIIPLDVFGIFILTIFVAYDSPGTRILLSNDSPFTNLANAFPVDISASQSSVPALLYHWLNQKMIPTFSLLLLLNIIQISFVCPGLIYINQSVPLQKPTEMVLILFATLGSIIDPKFASPLSHRTNNHKRDITKTIQKTIFLFIFFIRLHR